MALAAIDPQLIEAARRGEPFAIEQLLVRCQPDLRRFAMQSCSRADDVDDAVQEALVVLFQKLGALRTLAAFGGWLIQVVRNACNRLARGRRAALPLDWAEAVSARGLEVELRHDLADAIASLDPIYREVLILRDVWEHSGNETAAKLDISLEAVKSRLHRARCVLREKLVDFQPSRRE